MQDSSDPPCAWKHHCGSRDQAGRIPSGNDGREDMRQNVGFKARSDGAE